MTVKIIGITLLLMASVIGCGIRIGTARRVNQRVRAIAAMLERVEGMIRWQELSLPRALRQESGDPLAGEYIEKILEYAESETPLQTSWVRAFCEIQPKEAAEILCNIELSGDKQQIMGALHLASQQLRQLAVQTASEQGEKERLCLAVGFSFAGFLVIVLL